MNVELRRAPQICNDAPSGIPPFSSWNTAHSIMFTLWQRVKSHALKWEGLIVSGYQEVTKKCTQFLKHFMCRENWYRREMRACSGQQRLWGKRRHIYQLCQYHLLLTGLQGHRQCISCCIGLLLIKLLLIWFFFLIFLFLLFSSVQLYLQPHCKEITDILWGWESSRLLPDCVSQGLAVPLQLLQ